ncbi:MAG: hypothetical protein AAF638_08565 [Pseudomonadota bacterium]
MSALFRFLARALTAAGFAMLGADLLASLEAWTPSPYTLAWAYQFVPATENLTTIEAAMDGPPTVAVLPLSLALLWLGAIIFVIARKSPSHASAHSASVATGTSNDHAH